MKRSRARSSAKVDPLSPSRCSEKDLDEEDVANTSDDSETEFGSSPRTQLLLRKIGKLGRKMNYHAAQQNRFMSCSSSTGGAPTSASSTSCSSTTLPSIGMQSSTTKSCEFGVGTEPFFATRTLHTQTEAWDCLRRPPSLVLQPSEEQLAKEKVKQFGGQATRSDLETSGGSSSSSSHGSSAVASLEREVQAAKQSLETLNLKLRSRDAQVTNLTAQLKTSRQTLWNERQLSARADARLKEVAEGYGDPAHQRVVQQLTEKLAATGEKLNFERMRAMRWALIARQQRQFFKHTEALGEPPNDLKQNHPAGEIFLPPPPMTDEDEEAYGDLWDVGTGAGANPYNVDSWPLEPNVLASKVGKQVPFGEGILEVDEESDDMQEEDCD